MWCGCGRGEEPSRRNGEDAMCWVVAPPPQTTCASPGSAAAAGPEPGRPAPGVSHRWWWQSRIGSSGSRAGSVCNACQSEHAPHTLELTRSSIRFDCASSARPRARTRMWCSSAHDHTCQRRQACRSCYMRAPSMSAGPGGLNTGSRLLSVDEVIRLGRSSGAAAAERSSVAIRSRVFF